ncbi:Hypothetical protein PHPALM_3293 [Phytophthora palmivora]|uniref:FHA domain-containing protein n=1 Tax=Phytophthora palmivora TaxID=4796 RepID=A0A2P4YMU0_9STRA|nr:Hypothetical protein PHPALM_3293 [Phytophthora palmivora]
MPFLRSLEVDTSLELRSSKTLIGTGETTCDVVISGDNVLELHALLNLSADKTSARLIPFSTMGNCYVNDIAVPRDGVVVVHGDRVAFGNTHNAFLLELTPHPQMTSMLQQSIRTENSMQHTKEEIMDTGAPRTFRKALDALRGDRKISTPNASVAASIQSNLQSARNRSTLSSSASSAPPSLKSKTQLSKFLLEASTDSLLSDYVERKLNQRRSRQSSVTSSNYNDNMYRSRTSREERNLAEVEKLRLSQRIREVNDVLNGDLEFQESYLSPSSKSSRTCKPRWAVESTHQLSIESDEDSKEDDEDELPTMMEKAPNLPNLPVSFSVSIQTEHSDQESNSQPNRDEAEELNGMLDSLESIPVSETTQTENQRDSSPSRSSNPAKLRGFVSKAIELGLNDLTRSHYSRPIKTERQQAAKTALQQKLVNQVIRRKKNEIMSEAFVRWKRGLRAQSLNRERKGRQLEEVNAALGRLRRDTLFFRWRDYTAMSSQVMICRIEAFQRRCETRLAQKCWTALKLNFSSIRQRSKLIRGLVIKKARLMRHAAFRRWEQFVRKCSTKKHLDQLNKAQRVERRKLEAHLNQMSRLHYTHKRVQPVLIQILRRWKAITDHHKQQRQILRRILVHGNLKVAQRAWRKWNEVALIARHTLNTKKQTEQHIQVTTERLTTQHEHAQTSMRENHADQLQKLMEIIEEKDRELDNLKRQQRAEALEKVDSGVIYKFQHDLPNNSLSLCDEQIARASDHLEALLQNAEDDILGARFGAAQVGSHVKTA